MKKTHFKRSAAFIMAGIMFFALSAPVFAETVDDVKKQQEETKEQLEEVNEQMESLSSEKAAVTNEINELDTQLVDILTSISVCEDEIAAKEDEIFVVKGQLKEAEEAELAQYENMKTRIRFMYEKGDSAYMQLLLEGNSLTDMINKASYAEKLYEYDREMLVAFANTKEEVAALKTSLEIEEADLLTAQQELKLEQNELESLIAQKRATVANFDDQLKAAKAQAEGYKAELKNQNEKIRELEEKARKEKEEKLKKEQQEKAAAAIKEATKRTAKTDDGGEVTLVPASDPNAVATSITSDNYADTGVSDEALLAMKESSTSINAGEANEIGAASYSSAGSGLGGQIASYACQFIGNPYVAGGTSLTNGADCSGFTQSVYAHFGIKIPRNSTGQRAAGREVSYAEAQPGDIICYAGHVAIYLGNGQIVHASTERTGIKTSRADYRMILSVRRYV